MSGARIEEGATEVRGDDAAAGDRRDVRYARKDAGVAQKSDQTEVVKTRPETATGQGKPDPPR